MSLTVTCSVRPARRAGRRARRGRARSWCTRGRSSTPRAGTLSLAADQIRQVGVGELLARLEHLRRVLAAEGLFAADRKRPLPFLPGVVGRGLRARVGRREGRRRERPPALAGGAVPGRGGRGAGPERGDRGHRGAAAARRRPRGRRHRGHPRRRLAGGPAAVLQRGAGARRRRLPHAGRQRDRPRAGHPAARPGRRRARLHARPTRPSGSCPTSPRSSTGSPQLRRRRTEPRSARCSTGRPRPCARCAAARCSPTRTTC